MVVRFEGRCALNRPGTIANADAAMRYVREMRAACRTCRVHAREGQAAFAAMWRQSERDAWRELAAAAAALSAAAAEVADRLEADRD